MRIFHEPVTLRGYLFVSVVGLGIGVVAARPVPKPAVAPTIAVEAVPQSSELPPPHVVYEEAPASTDIKLMFDDAGSYLALQDLDRDALPRHGKFHTVFGDTTTSAPVAVADLPQAARAWVDRKVIVDGDCEAKVTEFAIVSRVSGDASYASNESEPARWTTHEILARGHVMLAAKLDRCAGTFARAASAPAIRTFVDVGGGNLDEARRRLIASDAGADVATEWTASAEAGQWFDHSEITTKTVRDPATGRIWISMHAHNDFSCGGANVNVWGLFRVEDDGALTTVQLRALGNLAQIDRLIDTNGDGIPELVGRGWLGPDAMITNAAGDELVRLDTPFFGCPC